MNLKEFKAKYDLTDEDGELFLRAISNFIYEVDYAFPEPLKENQIEDVLECLRGYLRG